MRGRPHLLHRHARSALVVQEIVGVDLTMGISITRWESMLPEDPDDLEGKKSIAGPFLRPDMLPLNRVCYQCSVCKLDFTEEE